MASRLFLHIGGPKTGTTFLQSVMDANRDALLEQGVLYATGRYPNDRIWAQEIARGLDLSGHPKPFAWGAWDRIKRQVNSHEGDAVVSHEFFCACDASQARWVVDQFEPAELHVVLTARDYVRQAAAAWQERLKSVQPVKLEDFSLDESTAPRMWSWLTFDIEAILARWALAVPVERIHLVTVPQPGRADSPLWPRFASVIGVEADSCDTKVVTSNKSLGVVEAELLRRVDERVPVEFRNLMLGHRWVRNVLASSILSARAGEKFGLPPKLAAEMVERSHAAARAVEGAGYDIVGDVQDLVPDGDVSAGRAPEEVPDSELLDAALDTISGLLSRLEEQRLKHLDKPRSRPPSARPKPPASVRTRSLPEAARSLLEAARTSDAPSLRLARGVLARVRDRRAGKAT